ncbi:MAG TPA: hypothetical protein VK541_25600 [Pedobacter sp.]|jgi:hypothetical protein|uniref:CIS tube protein n=1 Tax=Pedobacter TaxID=84567 RepID=UPI002550CCD8|nr:MULTISPECIES: hypothetical protein [Pedobacter]HMI05888.1 hypothetical protein [Pedobacter sp.]
MSISQLLGELGNLEKLVIEVYTGRDYSGSPAETFNVLYNPNTYFIEYKNELDSETPVNATDSVRQFKTSGGKELKLDLLWDATSASYSGNSTFQADIQKDKTVHKVIEKFIDTCFKVKDDTHQPYFLKIHWGEFTFQGILTAVKVTYTLFDNTGKPLRAKTDCTFSSYTSLVEQSNEQQNNSPDLTHQRTVEGTTPLPLMTFNIYKNDRYYLEVARANRLNNFRKLKQGQQILFPPIEK